MCAVLRQVRELERTNDRSHIVMVDILPWLLIQSKVHVESTTGIQVFGTSYYY